MTSFSLTYITDSTPLELLLELDPRALLRLRTHTNARTIFGYAAKYWDISRRGAATSVSPNRCLFIKSEPMQIDQEGDHSAAWTPERLNESDPLGAIKQSTAVKIRAQI